MAGQASAARERDFAHPIYYWHGIPSEGEIMRELNPVHAEIAACLNVGQVALGRAVKGLSPEQLLTIPPGFKNNILWNIGHVPVILSLLACVPTESEAVVPGAWEPLFKNGSSPADWTTPPDPTDVMEVFRASVPKICEALKAGELDHFVAFDLFPGYTIGSIEHALTFHSFHSGIHLGMVNSLKKFV